MGDVIPLTVVPGDGYHCEADDALETARGKLNVVLILGWEPDGSLYVSSSHGEPDNFRLLAVAQAAMTKAYTDEAED
jgi:hypothetical protein